mgnify:FL=1
MQIPVQKITSRTNPLVLTAASLSERKYREKHGLFLAEGKKLAKEALAFGAPVRYVFLAESRAEEHFPLFTGEDGHALPPEAEVFLLSDSCFEKISTEKSPEGVILAIKHLDFSEKYYKINNVAFYREKSNAFLLLSAIRDPGNLGTILRSAGAFGISCVLLSEDCADVYHPRAVRAAMGAVFHVATRRIDDPILEVGLLRQAGRRVFAAELRPGAKPIGAVRPCMSDVFIIGNEGHGIPAELSAACDAGVYIPIAENAESLNAAAAAAVLLWEQSRRDEP